MTVISADSACEGEEAVETLRHSPRRTMMDRKKLVDRLTQMDQKSTVPRAKGNLGPVSISSGNGAEAATTTSTSNPTTTSMGNEVSATAWSGKSRKRGTLTRGQHASDGSTGSGKSSSAGASGDTQPSDLFSSNVSLSACSLLDVEDNAEDDEPDEDEEDEDLGPMTRKAFSTYENHNHGGDNLCGGGDSGQATRGGKLASILRGCGTCGTGSYCTAPSCTACSGTGRTKRVSPTNGDFQSFAKRGAKRDVCFSETLVTDTHERPRTEDAELNDHFYNINDFRKFKRQARDEGHCEQQLIHMLRDFCTTLQDCSEGDFG